MNIRKKVLVIDDDLNICEVIRLYMKKEGFDVETSHESAKGIKDFRLQTPHIVILDIMLPGIDGLSVFRELKKISDIPIIMLTAKGDVFDKVLGLELGADDYIVKPFDAKELVARVKAVLRRYEHKEADVEEIVFPNFIINKTNYSILTNGKNHEIPPKELELLYFLASNVNRVFTRKQLLENVWGYDFFGDSRTVDVHIKRIQGKI